MGGLTIPYFPDKQDRAYTNFHPEIYTRASFRGMSYFDISKNEVAK